MEFKIEDNIEYSKDRNSTLYKLIKDTFLKLEVGQSFMIPASEFRHIKPDYIQSRLTYHLKAAVALLNKKEKFETKYTTAGIKEKGKLIGVRIWRTK